jgi:hypothetical protein
MRVILYGAKFYCWLNLYFSNNLKFKNFGAFADPLIIYNKDVFGLDLILELFIKGITN